MKLQEICPNTGFSDPYFPVYGPNQICIFPVNKDRRKPVFWHISRRTRCEIRSKLTIKTPEYKKLMIKLTIKTPLTLFWSLYY